MKINKFFKVMVPALSACLLPLPAINNVVTDIHNEEVATVNVKATNDLYYGTISKSNDNQENNDEVEENYDNCTTFSISTLESTPLPTPEKLEFTKHDPINPDDLEEDLGYYSVMLKPHMEGDVVIPETYNGLPVTQIDRVEASTSSSNSSDVQTIYIPQSINFIDSCAFYNSKVETIIFHGNVPTFSESSFSSCKDIANIVAPDDYLDDYINVLSNKKIFNYCSTDITYLPLSSALPLEYIPLVDKEKEVQGYSVKLNENLADDLLNGKVFIPDSYNGLPILKLEDGMFANQKNITGISLPSQLEVIGDQCFYMTPNLKEISLPASVKSIGSEAFYSEETVDYLPDSPGILTFDYEVPKNIYFSNPECILEDVQANSFNGVANIYLPYSNTSLTATQDVYASYVHNQKLEKLTNLIHIQPTLDKYTLEMVYSSNDGSGKTNTFKVSPKNISTNHNINGPIIIPSVYKDADGIDHTISSIEENCFVDYGNVPYIYFDDSYDFTDNKGNQVKDPSISETTLTICKNAFNNPSIRDIKLPRKNDYKLAESWTSNNPCSQDEIFGKNLNAIYVDDKIPFHYTSDTHTENHWTVNFNSYNELIATLSNYEDVIMQFDHNKSVTANDCLEFVLSEDGKSYGVKFNSKCNYISNAKVLEIPSEYNGLPVVEILDFGFGTELIDDCDKFNLTKVIIPDSIVKIGYGAFANCKSLKEVEFDQEGSLMMIDDYAFNGCDNIKSLNIPGTIKICRQSAFNNMSGLETITFNGFDDDIFAKSSSIPQFSGCNNLKTIQVPYVDEDEKGHSYKSLFSANASKLRTIPSYEYFNFELIEEEIEDTIIVNEETGEEEPYIDSYYKVTPNEKFEADRNSITELNFPSVVNGIPVRQVDGDFNNLPNLEKVYIGANIELLGNENSSLQSENFRYCENLKTIEVDQENTCFSMMYGTSNTSGCLIQGDEVNMDCSNVVTAIGQVDLYGNIYSISKQAFKGCSAMTEFSVYNQSLETKEELGLSANCSLGDFLNAMYSEDDLKALKDEINSEDNEDLDFTFDEMMNYDMRFAVWDEAFYDCANLSRINFFSSEIPAIKKHSDNSKTQLEIIFNNTYPVNWQKAYPDCYFYSLIDSGEILEESSTCRGGGAYPDSQDSGWYHAAKDSNGLRSSWVDGSDWSIHETLYRLRDHYEWVIEGMIDSLRETDPEAADNLEKLIYRDPEHANDILNIVGKLAEIIFTTIGVCFTLFSLVDVGIAISEKIALRIARGAKPKKIKSKSNGVIREHSKPVDSVEPVKPVDPVEPVKPVDPVEPVKPVDPVEPVNPIKPIDENEFVVWDGKKQSSIEFGGTNIEDSDTSIIVKKLLNGEEIEDQELYDFLVDKKLDMVRVKDDGGISITSVDIMASYSEEIEKYRKSMQNLVTAGDWGPHNQHSIGGGKYDRRYICEHYSRPQRLLHDLRTPMRPGYRYGQLPQMARYYDGMIKTSITEFANEVVNAAMTGNTNTYIIRLSSSSEITKALIDATKIV